MLVLGRLADHDLDLIEPGEFAGAQSPFTGNEFVGALSINGHNKWLSQAVLLDRARKIAERFRVEVATRLKVVGPDLRDGYSQWPGLAGG